MSKTKVKIVCHRLSTLTKKLSTSGRKVGEKERVEESSEKNERKEERENI